jgi:transposase
VHEYLAAVQTAGVRWPLPADWDDSQVERTLFPQRPVPAFWRKHPEPDWGQIHQELQTHKDLTLQLVWQEGRENDPEGYGYSRFCDLYRRWLKKLDLVLRQEHRAGEKMFVDYAGATIPVYDPQSGEAHPAAVFVAVLGASSYTFAEAASGQDLRSWVGSHMRAFEFFGGVTEVVVPDNLKSALVHQEVDVHLTAETVEVLHRGVRVASHIRSDVPAKATSLPEHMPKAHQRYLGRTPSTLIEDGQQVGPWTGQLVEAILAAKRHPEQGYRSCLGILRLAKTYPPERMEAAARRCLRARAYNFQSMDSILKNQLDRLPLPGDPPARSAVEHDNIRGAGYFDSPPEIDPPVIQ